MRKFSKSNPNTLKNIENWISINHKNFRLISNIYVGSPQKMWFNCNFCLNNFDITLENILAGQNCPYCAINGKRLSSRNSFCINFPELALEWDFIKNKDLDINNIKYGSDEKAWWICSKCGYNYRSNISSRTINGNGCSSCSGKVVTDKNRLSLLYEDIVLEWDYVKNKKLPSEYACFSNKKVFWICSFGHEWITSISNRTNLGEGCPTCNNSKGEEKIRRYLENNKMHFKKEMRIAECRYKYSLPFDFGVYIENRLFLIEYQGRQHYESISYWGGDENFNKVKIRDGIKKDFCINNNIPFIEIPYWDFDNIE